jgi:hypothetical protein
MTLLVPSVCHAVAASDTPSFLASNHLLRLLLSLLQATGTAAW